MFNRKFMRTDDAMKDSEETATAFNVAITRERSFSLLIHESKSKPIEAVSFLRIATAYR